MICKPWVSVVVALYNAENHIVDLVLNLRNQLPPTLDDHIEILLIDGGSNDHTLSLIQELGEVVHRNPFGDAGSAKCIGWDLASSDFVCFVDQDERLLDARSLQRKVAAIKESWNCHIALPSGYELKRSSGANRYGSEFGDPISFFLYNTPNRTPFRERHFRRELEIVFEDADKIYFRSVERRRPVLIEIPAGGHLVDKKYFDRRLSTLEFGRKKVELGHLYYLDRTTNPSSTVVLMKNDPVEHYSSDSWRHVMRKIRWRIDNVISGSSLAEAGNLGRLYYLDKSKVPFKLSHPKFAVLFYVLSGKSIYDSLRLCAQRRESSYLMHAWLVVYAITIFGLHSAKKQLRLAEKSRRYGE